jgi:HEAT repeat protein
LLIRTLEGPELPRSIQRGLVSALGRIGDPRAVDALIAVNFRIPDTPSTLSIGERSLRALGAIGEGALPGVLATFAGNNRRVNELVQQLGFEQELVRLVMLKVLAIIGSPRAIEPILQSFPRAGCGRERAPTDEYERMELLRARSFYANTLGFIADPAGVPILCSCNGVSEDPSDVWEIASALGRIGGEQALACLSTLVQSGRYDADSIGDAALEFEIRWQAFRWAIIAAPPSKVDALFSLLQAATPDVRVQIERNQLDVGLRPLQECGEDTACYREVLDDDRRLPFEREVAAFNLARRATPGDLELAAALAAAFETPDPEVRINMAWLAGKVAAGRACPECVHNLEAVMAAEDSTKSPMMQGAWILARQTIDKAHAGTP